MGGAGGFGGAGAAAAAGMAAMAYAGMQANNQNNVRQRRRPRSTSEEEAATGAADAVHRSKVRVVLGFVVGVCVMSWLIIQVWVGAQDGMFEFMGIDASREEYLRRIEAFYAEFNPEKLEGETHSRPVDAILWKYRGKEKKLLAKLKKKYSGKQPARVTSEAIEAAEAEISAKLAAKDMKVAQLRRELKRLQLSTEGSKQDLKDRLQAARDAAAADEAGGAAAAGEGEAEAEDSGEAEE